MKHGKKGHHYNLRTEQNQGCYSYIYIHLQLHLQLRIGNSVK